MYKNFSLANFMQILTECLPLYLKKKDDIVFVQKTLEMTQDFLLEKAVSPDTLYDRLENINEEDILTYFDLDKESASSVWVCIADFVAYICKLSYDESGEQYLPETIEAVDDMTLTEFFTQYKENLSLFSDLSVVATTALQEKKVDLTDKAVKAYYIQLFGDDKYGTKPDC
ncbi:Imm6 family immunity protein [Streptococcus oricebi]|uniref:Immunity protein Imm6 n=1 Tax=Streptococcus oricebi TaxID=1547447 RepID=A0ABS5B4U8_9STRE|nr:Imm6 family immunity protein [Streptococcus oricebi]MBP2623835.1 hypothetical protein [Streptococcus oricebi]